MASLSCQESSLYQTSPRNKEILQWGLPLWCGWIAERLGLEKGVEVPDGDKLVFATLKKGDVGMHRSFASLDTESAGLRQGPTFLFVEVANLDEIIAATKGAR